MGGSLGLSDRVYTLDAPLDDATKSKVWTQELRLTGASQGVRWLVGGFYAHSKRDYGQSVRPKGVDSLAAAEALRGYAGLVQGAHARIDELFFSDLHNKLTQSALFGEARWQRPIDSTSRGSALLQVQRDRSLIFDGAFAVATGPTGTTDASGLSPRLIVSYKASNALTLNAQASRGFRLGESTIPSTNACALTQDTLTYGP